jgi:hypothetical protein
MRLGSDSDDAGPTLTEVCLSGFGHLGGSGPRAVLGAAAGLLPWQPPATTTADADRLRLHSATAEGPGTGSPSGRRPVLVSLSQRAVAAIAYEVQLLDAAVKVVLQSELIANEQLPLLRGDPRTGATQSAPLVERADAARGARTGMVHSTRHTDQCVVAAMDHVVDGPPSSSVQSEKSPWPTLTLIVSLEAIFLSTFGMIGQTRAASFQQAKADRDFIEQETELKTNTQLTREIHALTTELTRRTADRP